MGNTVKIGDAFHAYNSTYVYLGNNKYSIIQSNQVFEDNSGEYSTYKRWEFIGYKKLTEEELQNAYMELL